MWTIEPTDRPGAFLVRSPDGREQSHVDLDDPTYLAFDYVRRMADIVDTYGVAGDPVRVVHVGGAGLTLPRYLSATRPGSNQIVLEPDETVTDLVRRDLPLPRRSGIKVRAVSGRAGVFALRDQSVEVMVLDAFSEGSTPLDLLSVEQVEHVARVITESGWYVLNLAGGAPFQGIRRALAAVRTAFPHVLVGAEPATLRGRREGNLVVVASRAPLPLAALRKCAASSPAPYRVLDDRQTSDTLGGGRPWTDAEIGILTTD